MTVDLNVLMYLAWIALIVAGVIALVYLALMFKAIINTMATLQETLKAVNRDLIKLESPLDTVDQISNTVDEVHASAKKAAISAIDVFSAGTEKLGDMLKKKSAPASVSAEQEKTVQADFQEIKQTTQKIEKDLTAMRPENDGQN